MSLRFEFGKNWTAYSKHCLTPENIAKAREDFSSLFDGINLSGKTFLDVGFGQGLALCLATEKGARVSGIDIDPFNLSACKRTIQEFDSLCQPNLQIASILDDEFVTQTSQEDTFDIVHSWGVLHHTGNMYHAIQNCIQLLKPDGIFVISIYQTHWSSPFWTVIKSTYNRVPPIIRTAMIWFFYPIIYIAKAFVTNLNPLEKERGMDFYHDVVDWVGGYPYEHARHSEIEDFAKGEGLVLIKSTLPKVPTGCIEYVFKKRI